MRFPILAYFARSGASTGWNGQTRARTRIRLVLLLLLTLNAVLVALVSRPRGHTLLDRQEELRSVRARQEEGQNAVVEMRDLRGKVEVALQNGEEFSRKNFLTRHSAFSAILTDLEHLASESRLKPAGTSYQLEDEKERPGWTNVEVTLGVEGEYPDLVRFINHLEQSNLFWIIDSLNVAGASTGTPSRGLRLTLKMQTYFIPS